MLTRHPFLFISIKAKNQLDRTQISHEIDKNNLSKIRLFL